jgi:hypothetical protein
MAVRHNLRVAGRLRSKCLIITEKSRVKKVGFICVPWAAQHGHHHWTDMTTLHMGSGTSLGQNLPLETWERMTGTH